MAFQQEQHEQKSLISFVTRDIIVVKISCKLNFIFLHKSSKNNQKELALPSFYCLSKGI